MTPSPFMCWPDNRSTRHSLIRSRKREIPSSICFFRCLQMEIALAMCSSQIPRSSAPCLALTKVFETSGEILLPQSEAIPQHTPKRRMKMATTDPLAAVRQYIDRFNKGDEKGMAATFAVPGSIIDGMAPHVWQGPTASQD